VAGSGLAEGGVAACPRRGTAPRAAIMLAVSAVPGLARPVVRLT